MPFILLLIVLTLVPDSYIYFYLIRDADLVWRLLHWLPMALMIIFFVLWLISTRTLSHQMMLRLVFGILFFTSFPKFSFMLWSLVGRLADLVWSWGFKVFNYIGLGFAGITFCWVFYGFTFGWRRLITKRVDIEFPDLPPAFDGYKIAHLSDFHIGSYQTAPKMVGRVVNMTNGLKPDAVFFTGDLVNSHPNEVRGFEKELMSFSAPVYSILGNHDYLIYYPFTRKEDRAKALENLKDIERGFGWDLLLDENRILERGGESIALVGVENISKPPFPSHGNLKKAMEGLPEGIFKILLSHDPLHWRHEILPGSDVQLTLSGHTHAMQLQFGNQSPASLGYREWGGLYSREGRYMFVSKGNGSNVPFRYGAWPEVCLITLHKK